MELVLLCSSSIFYSWWLINLMGFFIYTIKKGIGAKIYKIAEL
jgi:hypothetical protein